MAVPSLRWAVLAWGLSVIAETASLVALLVVAYEVGGPGLVAGFSILRAMPALIVAPVVIGWSDRGRRESLADEPSSRRGPACWLWPLPSSSRVRRWRVLLAGGLASVLFSTHRPMSGALLPHLATSPAQLTAANAASAFAESAGTLVGPVLAGVLLVVGPPPLGLALAAVVVGAAAVAVRRIHDVAPSGDPGSAMTLASAIREFGGGLRALIRQPPLVALVFVQTFARGVLLIAVVVLAVDTFGQGDPGVGWLTAMLGVGGLAGSAAAAALVTSTRISRAVAVGVALWGLPMVALGALTVPAVGYVGFVVIGVGNAVLDVGAFTLVARVIPPTMLGRAFAAFEVILVLGVTTGSLVAGLAVPAFGVGPSLWLTGCVLVALAAGSIPWARRLDARLIPGDNVSALRECRELDSLPAGRGGPSGSRRGRADVRRWRGRDGAGGRRRRVPRGHVGSCSGQPGRHGGRRARAGKQLRRDRPVAPRPTHRDGHRGGRADHLRDLPTGLHDLRGGAPIRGGGSRSRGPGAGVGRRAARVALAPDRHSAVALRARFKDYDVGGELPQRNGLSSAGIESTQRVLRCSP